MKVIMAILIVISVVVTMAFNVTVEKTTSKVVNSVTHISPYFSATVNSDAHITYDHSLISKITDSDLGKSVSNIYLEYSIDVNCVDYTHIVLGHTRDNTFYLITKSYFCKPGDLINIHMDITNSSYDMLTRGWIAFSSRANTYKKPLIN